MTIPPAAAVLVGVPLLVILVAVLWACYRDPYREARRRANREIRHN